jgi:hypothetical protein
MHKNELGQLSPSKIHFPFSCMKKFVSFSGKKILLKSFTQKASSRLSAGVCAQPCFEYVFQNSAINVSKVISMKNQFQLFSSGLSDFSWHNIPKLGKYTK